MGCVSAIDSEGRTIWIVDARGYGKRFIVRADEKLTAFFALPLFALVYPASIIRDFKGIFLLRGRREKPQPSNSL